MSDEASAQPEPAPSEASSARRPRRATTCVILACLGLQLAVFVPGLDRLLPHFPYYPFLKYNMYADAHTGTPTTTQTRMYATLSDGSTAECGHKDVGLQFFVWEYKFVAPMREGGPEEELALAQATEIAQRSAEVNGMAVTAVHVETTTFRLHGSDLEERVETVTFTFEEGVSP